MKQNLIAVVAIFIAWFMLDYVIHGLILQSSYAASQGLWRPYEEMKYGLLYFVIFVSAVTFVLIYSSFFKEKTLGTGIKYGLLFGIGAGISMGYGTYSIQPIPYPIALTWFLGTLVESVVAGALVGTIVKGDVPGDL